MRVREGRGVGIINGSEFRLVTDRFIAIIPGIAYSPVRPTLTPPLVSEEGREGGREGGRPHRLPTPAFHR